MGGFIYNFFFKTEVFSACEVGSGELQQSPADRFRGGGRDQSEGHRDHACVGRGSHGKAMADVAPGEVRSHV